MTDEAARVIIADDHMIVSEAVRSLLQPEYTVVAAVADGRALLRAARELRPQAAIVDIAMPLLNGIDAIRVLAQEQPQLRTVCLTMHADRAYLQEAFAAGASGYVVKHGAGDELRTALRTVLSGGEYVSPPLGIGQALREPAPEVSPPGVSGFALTQRQRQVLQLVAEGYTVKQIARLLKLSPKTVESHKYRLLASLGYDSTAQLVQFALRNGLIA